MTDTDKLKRLAEAAKKAGGDWECSTEEGSDFIEAANPEAILALIAENERLKAQAEFGKHAAQDERERLNRTVVAKLKIAAAALRDTKYMLTCIGHDMPHIDKALAVVDA